jgi:site-specific DNA recombinase
MKKIVAYCRTSTENQKEEKTIDLQVESLTSYALMNEFEIVEWFKDDGVSGGLENRPQLLRMMKYLEENEDVQYALIYKLDRLARDLYIQEGLIREFAKLKKEVISTLEPDLASNDPFRKAFRQMLGVFAEFEKAMITLRMKNGRDSSVSKGKWHGGLIFGYDTENGVLTVNPVEAEIVKKIYYLKRYKQSSPSVIAKLLNREGIPTKRKSTKWYPTTIKKILTNKMYKGKITYKGEDYAGQYKTII